jgi:TolB-like protein/DNA-binding winged helix-turn-helix (wHTH) protein/Tfp pilus assembly protein PilF
MPSQPAGLPRPVKFAEDFELDPATYELRREGRRLKLERIPMELLLFLVEERGRLVTREQIIEKIWGKDVFLDADTSINSAIRKIRQVLKDDPEKPRFIHTVSGRGYRFIAPVVDLPPAVEERENASASSAVATKIAEGAPSRSAAPARRKRVWLAAVLTLGVLIILALLLGTRRQLFTRAAPIRSIAVLPLENLSGDQGQQYFSDGMTDALITSLAQIGSLRVISRTSSMHYLGSRQTLPEIAKELGVDAVVEGSVVRSGNRVRIDAQLIQGATDRHLWAKSYERDLQDVLALQGELARTIAAEVQIQLTAKEAARLAKAPPVRPEAYEAYLEGRFFWNKRNKEAVKKSIEYFNQAIQLDPGYAAAYSGLADAYITTACGRPGGLPLVDAGPRAKAAALKAVELDESSAEAHAALGFVKACYEWDRPGAENEYRRAIALNPNYATAHHWYAALLLGWRDQEGLDQIREALRLDPVSPNINGLFGDLLIQVRQFDKAVEQLRKTVDLDPQQYNSRVRLGLAYAQLHRYAEAKRELQAAEEISPGSVLSFAALAYVYGLEGKTAIAESMLPEVKTRAASAGHPSVLSLAYIGLNRKDNSLLWLEQAYEQRDPYLHLDLNLESPLLDPLRSEARFHDLERQVRTAQQIPAGR